jgi:hypothetical protein
MQPFTDDISALLAISWPFLREAAAGHVVAFDTERVPDDLGGAVAVVAIDCLFKKVRHECASSLCIRRVRVFDLEPMWRPAPAINRAETLRYNSLASELTGRAKDRRAVLLEMLIEDNARHEAYA